MNVRGRLIVTGMGKSGIIARKMTATLTSTGTPAIFLHPADAGHGDLGMITPEDVVLMLLHSGESNVLISEERRDGTEGSNKCRYRWSTYIKKKKSTIRQTERTHNTYRNQ